MINSNLTLLCNKLFVCVGSQMGQIILKVYVTRWPDEIDFSQTEDLEWSEKYMILSTSILLSTV